MRISDWSSDVCSSDLQLLHSGLAADIGHQPRAPRRSALIGERSIVRIRAVIDPVFQRLPAGLLERGLLKLAVLHGDHAPAAGLEDIVEAAEHAVGCRRVQRLAIIEIGSAACMERVSKYG